MAENEKLLSANLPHVERHIGEHLYRVTRLDWWGAQEIIEGLTKVLGPSLEGLASGVALEKALDMDIAHLLPAIAGALARAVGAQGRQIQQKLGLQTIVETDGRSVILDKTIMGIWFSQHPKEVLPWLAFSLEVQVTDFFEPLIAVLTTGIDSQKSAYMTAVLAELGKVQKSQDT